MNIGIVLACTRVTGPEVIKLFSCSTQLSMKFYMLIRIKEIKHFSGSDKPRMLFPRKAFFLLIKVEMPTIVL